VIADLVSALDYGRADLLGHRTVADALGDWTRRRLRWAVVMA
jgi:hypothetical protein